MRKFVLFGAALLAHCAAPAFAGQAPNPMNAPASVTAGDALAASANPQAPADSGVSLTSAGQNRLLAGPCGGGAGAPTYRALCAADLPAATTGAPGAVEIGAGLSVSAGVASVTNPSPGTSVAGDVLTFGGGAGQLHDSGMQLSALLTAASAASTYLPLAGGALAGPLVIDQSATGTNGLLIEGQALGTTAGSVANLQEWITTQSNGAQLFLEDLRNASGTTWQTATRRLLYKIDATNQAYVDFDQAGMVSGDNGIALGIGGTQYFALETGAASAATLGLPLTITGSGATLLTIGNGSDGGSATPTELAFDATFATAASTGCKISLFGSGCAVGLGVSAGDQLNLMASTTALWGASGAEEMALTASGITAFVPITFSGTLPTGTAATFACFTAAGKLISSATAC
jgi:hypothetical protein